MCFVKTPIDPNQTLLHKRREAWQWCSTSRLVVHNDLSTIKADHSGPLLFRIGERSIIFYGSLSFPRLPQSIVHICIVVDEGVWFSSFTLRFTFRSLNNFQDKRQKINSLSRNRWTRYTLYLRIRRAYFRWLLC